MSLLIIFQSTLPYGSDALGASYNSIGGISIHAPSRERLLWRATVSRLINFNPRSLTGATIERAIWSQARIFQSTLPHGSDSNQDSELTYTEYFNPRSLTGATARVVAGKQSQEISIHAPLRERPWFCPDCRCERQFQSTLPRGSDITHSRYTQILPKFQSTLPHGSDGVK